MKGMQSNRDVVVEGAIMGPFLCPDDDIMNDGSAQAIPDFGQDFRALLNFLYADSDTETLSPERFAAVLRIDAAVLMASCRYPALSHGSEAYAMQRHLHEAVRVIRLCNDLFGNVEASLAWFQQAALPVFGGNTPHQLVSEDRTDDLVRYLSSLQAGFSG